MDEVAAKSVTGNILSANFRFKVPLYDEHIIQECLKNPECRMSNSLSEKLRVLQAMIRKYSAENRHQHFWKNIRTVIEDAIQHLSGKRREVQELNSVVPRNLKRSSSMQNVRRVLKVSELQCVVPFWFASPELFDPEVIKLAEGSFGEVYEIAKSDFTERVLKVIPVGGNSPLDNEPHLTFKEVMTEVTTSKELAKLANGAYNRCSTFPNIYRVCVVQDSFPETVIDAWRSYENRHNGSLHPRPDAYDSSQAFVTIETDIGGEELSQFKLLNVLEAVSIFKQVATAVAIAEEALEFEHRDLHVGNVLVTQCDEQEIDIKFKGRNYSLQAHGIRAMIIDFTYSRISTGDGVQFLELDEIYDVVRHSSRGFTDHRYVYSKMEQVTQSKWKEYYPRTNLLWMKHMTESLLDMAQQEGVSRTSNMDKIALVALRVWDRACLTYWSVSEFVDECILH